MVNYVNEEAFFKWYDSVSKTPAVNRQALLSDLFERYAADHKNRFELPASETVTGRAESYKFRFENLGCCGASTMFIYF